MNLRHLKAFATIVDLGGFAPAAERLNLSQPALSRQVQALEHDLGVRLFDRVGRRAHLSAEGEDLLRRSRHVLAEAESLVERARSLKIGSAGILRVGATPQVFEGVFAEFLMTYQRRHPAVDVHLVEEGGARLPARLERGDVHLSQMPAGDDRFCGRLLYPMHLLAVLAESHRLSDRAVLDVADLAEEPVLCLGHGFASRAWFEAACEAAHVRPRVLLESAAPQGLIALARAGYGIAVIPSPVRIPEGGVRVAPLVHRKTSIGRWAMIAWGPRRFLAPYAEQFADGYAAYTQRNHPGREHITRAPPLPRPKQRTS
jgi:DNA-binding transcriptional LysR family regulator